MNKNQVNVLFLLFGVAMTSFVLGLITGWDVARQSAPSHLGEWSTGTYVAATFVSLLMILATVSIVARIGHKDKEGKE